MRRQSASRRLALVAIATVLCATTTILVIQPIQCNSIQQAAPQEGGQAAAKAVEAASAVAPKVGEQAAKVAQEAPAPAAKSAEAAAAAAAAVDAPAKPQSEPERKGRASDQPTAKEATSEQQKSKEASSAATTTTSKPAVEQDKKAAKQPQLAGKSGAQSKSKLPANLGTVTSTGSGGPAHYMSKHDAYSAIAEKHGALAQDAMRHTQKVSSSGASKRTHLQRFGGVQKASGDGIGYMLSPFKGVTESDLARTLGASMRSIMKGKMSLPAYVASAVLGAVALLAFYESPISPLPVPALPEPPVGRFPPEMPIISPNLQVPFRLNQQQQQQQQQYGQQAYANQRSYPGAQMLSQQQLQAQQVLFPGATAQQRQMNAGNGGPVQQLAANLLSSVSGKQQNAQRKSGSDYDNTSSRSLFGGAPQTNGQHQKLGAPANQQQKQSNSFLSFFGLGSGSGASSATQVGAAGPQDLQQAASGQTAAGIDAAKASQTAAAASAMSNSHVVNKVKSYFARAPNSVQSAQAGGPAPAGGQNPYDQYQRMSFMQALAKDTAFLPAFLNPSRKSSPASGGSSSSTSTATKIQQSISNVLSAAAGSSSSPQPMPAASRMQVDGQLAQYGAAAMQQQQQQQATANSNKRASSGFGLMRAADKIAHALLDTFTSGMLQRHSAASHQQAAQQQADARKSPVDDSSSSSIMSTASLLSDLMLSSYAGGQQQQQQQTTASQLVNSLAQAAGLPAMEQQQQQQQQAAASETPKASDQMSARSDQQPAAATEQAAIEQKPTQTSGSSKTTLSQDQASLVRKTRSIGLEYPTYELAAGLEQQPSKAAQINNLVDLVSDSYKQNKMLFNFVMNRVGLGHTLPYVEQLLGDQQIAMANQLIQQ